MKGAAEKQDITLTSLPPRKGMTAVATLGTSAAALGYAVAATPRAATAAIFSYYLFHQVRGGSLRPETHPYHPATLD